MTNPSLTTPLPAVARSPRLSWQAFDNAVPGAVAALRTLGKCVDEAGLDKRMAELVKVRVSQINGCAYCLKLHLDWARQAGVPAVQLELLATWRDAGCFNERECAALAWAESLTGMATTHIDDDAHGQAARHFTASELAALTTAIALINAWNRIAGSLRFTPPGLAAPASAPASAPTSTPA